MTVNTIVVIEVTCSLLSPGAFHRALCRAINSSTELEGLDIIIGGVRPRSKRQRNLLPYAHLRGSVKNAIKDGLYDASAWRPSQASSAQNCQSPARPSEHGSPGFVAVPARLERNSAFRGTAM